MHRDVLGLVPKDGVVSDHINGNGLDNTRSNLRKTTPHQNAMNHGGWKNKKYSKYIGVCKDARRGTFCAFIRVNYRQINLGSYRSAKEAALAFNRAAKKYRGKYARLNKL